MVLKRGRDEKDFAKDLRDRARNIVAQGKEVPRLRNYNTDGDVEHNWEFPVSKMGFTEGQQVINGRNQARRIRDSSPFYRTEVPMNSRDNNRYGSTFFTDKMMFS